MGRYQLGEQIWSIERRGVDLVIVEPDGVERTEELASAADAQRRFTILTNQHLRDGWKLMRELEDRPPRPSPRTVHDARNPILEEQIFADPYAHELWQVYGDWLQEEGDPRGEHIALHAAVLQAPDDPVVLQRLRGFETRHGAYLRGGLHRAILGRGFVDELDIRDVDELGQLASDAARFVTKLFIRSGHIDELGGMIAAVAARAPRTLRELRVSGPLLETLAPLADRLAVLHKFELHVPLGDRAVELLATAAMPQLRELAIVQRGNVALDPIMARAAPPSLERLVVDRRANVELCKLVVDSPMAPQLKELTLCELGPAGAKVLAAHADRLGALVTLRLASAKLDRQTIQLLDEAFGHVDRGGLRYRLDY